MNDHPMAFRFRLHRADFKQSFKSDREASSLPVDGLFTLPTQRRKSDALHKYLPVPHFYVRSRESDSLTSTGLVDILGVASMTDQVETDAAKAAGEAEAVAMEVAESESATEQKGGEVDSKVAETTEKDGEGGEASASIGEVEGEGAPEQGEAEAKESKEETVDQPTMLEGSSFATVKLAIVEAINE